MHSSRLALGKEWHWTVAHGADLRDLVRVIRRPRRRSGARIGLREEEAGLCACLLALGACASAGGALPQDALPPHDLVAALGVPQDEDPQGEVPQEEVPQEEAEPGELVGDDPQAEEPESLEASSDAAHSGPAVHGDVRARYRYRAVDGEADHDLMTSILLDVGEAEVDPITAHLSGYATLDIDGVPTGDPPAFSDIADTYGSKLNGWLYEGYVDFHEAEDFDVIRVGRQDSQYTPVLVTFDGARLETRPLGDEKIKLETYGGVTAHFYEEDSDGDLVFGLAGSARPWEGGRARFDWMHLEDESLLGEHVNDLFALELWQRINRRLMLDGRASMLEGEARDMRLRGTYADPAQDVVVEADWTTLFNPQNDLVLELDPFTASLLALEPYDQARIQGSKGVGEDLILAAGVDLRRLKDGDDEGEFNREFDRLHATATSLDTFDSGLEVSLTGEIWDATGSNVNSWGADVSREWEDLEGSLGTYYSLYKLDLVAGEERDNVRTYYAEVEWQQGRSTTLEARYELEHDEFDTYHLVLVGLRWGF